MTKILPVSFYQFGDKVEVQWDDDGWTPGRVVGISRWRVRVATSLPYSIDRRNGLRVLPEGTPVYMSFRPDEIKLIDHDPHWQPFAIRPFLTPTQYKVLGGSPRFTSPGMPGLTHVGAYMSATDYEDGEPVWVWEDGWRCGNVISTKRTWIAVKYANGYRHPSRGKSKSYNPEWVWPTLCDYPKPITKVIVERDWVEFLLPDSPNIEIQ